MNTYGFHTIHGRAPAIATGLKIARPDLAVWVATGDGDALSIGGNHLDPHAAPQRRPQDPAVQQPDLRPHQGAVLADLGARQDDQVDAVRLARPPVQPALARARRRGDVRRALGRRLPAAPARPCSGRPRAHTGTAFVEILQNCNIFNDGALENLTEKELRDDHTIALEHGKPLVFGKERDKGIRMNGLELEVVQLGNGISREGPPRPRRAHPNPAYAFLLSRMDATPGFPTPLGVLRAVDAPRYEEQIARPARGGHREEGQGRSRQAAARGRHVGGAVATSRFRRHFSS